MKIFGYILSLAGIAGLAAYIVPQIKAQIPLPSQITGVTLLVLSLILIAVGLLMIIKSGGSSRQAREVPIYRGKNIVGYRRQR